MSSEWQLQEAKAKFSAVIKAAQHAPQIVTRHGEPVAVVLSLEQYRQAAARPRLLDFFRSWPEFEVPDRDRSDLGRDIVL